jgi:pyridoxamine 5'-phosphate oxidase
MINNKGLSEKAIDLNPFIQFDIWFKERLTSGIAMPDSVSLGTASADGRVSVRTVLLKDYSDNGFVFFTNYNSKKGSQLSSNHRAALLFYWPESGRQIRIEGVADKISEEESESYFKTRPRESQLSAWASEQSSVIPDRQHLEKRYDSYQNKFNNKLVDKPQHWGGYRLVPDWLEFWYEGDFRLHDRLTYTKRKDIWVIERLAP